MILSHVGFTIFCYFLVSVIGWTQAHFIPDSSLTQVMFMSLSCSLSYPCSHLVSYYCLSTKMATTKKQQLHDTSEYSLATNQSAVCSRLDLSNKGEFLFYTFSYEIPPPHFVWKFLKTRTHPVWSERFLTHSAPPALSKCGLKSHIACKIMTMMVHHASIGNFFTRVRGHD